MNDKTNDWKKLRIGDRIRFVRLPHNGELLFPETKRIFKKLIARGRSSRVFQIDEYRIPWIYCRFKRKNGSWEIHWLAVNDDSWVRVRSLKPVRRDSRQK